VACSIDCQRIILKFTCHFLTPETLKAKDQTITVRLRVHH
jgi:hypothetical protein